MSQFMENENRLRELLNRQQGAPWPIYTDEVRNREPAIQTAAEDQARAMSADYVEMHELRPLTSVKRDWRGPGRIWRAAAFCAAGSVAFAILVLFSLQAFFPGAF